MAVELKDGVEEKQKVSSTSCLDVFTGNNFNAAVAKWISGIRPKDVIRVQVPAAAPIYEIQRTNHQTYKR